MAVGICGMDQSDAFLNKTNFNKFEWSYVGKK